MGLFFGINQLKKIYYVDTAGTDSAGRSGFRGQEWKTLQYAATRVTTAGSTIHINAGTYVQTLKPQ
jgi:hypothetical protein